MQLLRTLAAALAIALALVAGREASAAERRLALVVGESAYPAKPLATAANDAGLIAQTLQAAGFDVTGARDLEETALKQAFRDFLDRTAEAGPDAVAFVYFSGYGLQLEGENYLVPVDAKISRDSDIPMRGLRVTDYLKPLAASGAKLAIMVLDAARANPFEMGGQPLAGGLALYEPGARALLAFNAAPGTIAPEGKGDYGAYAHALAEMIRDGGRPLMEVFENARLRVSETTKGAQIPWNSAKVETDFLFFQRDAGAPPRADDAAKFAQPMAALGPEDGFLAALRQDTLEGYQDYLSAYPSSPYAKQARALIAARREALTWRRSCRVNSANAYWSYLKRYPKGPHVGDARRRLAELSYDPEPPPAFDMIDYGYPPPPVEEIVYVERPVVIFDDPMWGFVPPPPPPVYLLPPPPPDFVVLPPPVVIAQPYVLPTPVYVPVPVWQRPPPYIAPPPNNFIYANVHNSVAVDPMANNVVVRNPAGAVISTAALTAAGAGAAAAAVGAALPHFIAKRNLVAPPVGMVPPGGGPVPISAPGASGPVAPGALRPPIAPAGPGASAVAPGGPVPGGVVAPLPGSMGKGPPGQPGGGGGAVVAPEPGKPGGALPGGVIGGPAQPGLPGARDHALPHPPGAAGKAATTPPEAGIASPLVPQPGAVGGPADRALPKPGRADRIGKPPLQGGPGAGAVEMDPGGRPGAIAPGGGAGEARVAPPPRAGRQRPPQGPGGGEAMSPRGVIDRPHQFAPGGGGFGPPAQSAPPHGRQSPYDGAPPQMRGMNPGGGGPGMPPQMRGMPRDVMPGGGGFPREAAQPRIREAPFGGGGFPPQMRQAPVDRGPPAGMGRAQPPMPQPAAPMMRSPPPPTESEPHGPAAFGGGGGAPAMRRGGAPNPYAGGGGGSFGGPPGFGGMR